MSLLDDVEAMRGPVRELCRQILCARLERERLETVGDGTLDDAVRSLAEDLLFSIGRGGLTTPLWWVEVATPFAASVPAVASRLAWLRERVESYSSPMTPDQAELVAEFRELTQLRLV